MNADGKWSRREIMRGRHLDLGHGVRSVRVRSRPCAAPPKLVLLPAGRRRNSVAVKRRGRAIAKGDKGRTAFIDDLEQSHASIRPLLKPGEAYLGRRPANEPGHHSACGQCNEPEKDELEFHTGTTAGVLNPWGSDGSQAGRSFQSVPMRSNRSLGLC